MVYQLSSTNSCYTTMKFQETAWQYFPPTVFQPNDVYHDPRTFRLIQFGYPKPLHRHACETWRERALKQRGSSKNHRKSETFSHEKTRRQRVRINGVNTRRSRGNGNIRDNPANARLNMFTRITRALYETFWNRDYVSRTWNQSESTWMLQITNYKLYE